MVPPHAIEIKTPNFNLELPLGNASPLPLPPEPSVPGNKVLGCCGLLEDKAKVLTHVSGAETKEWERRIMQRVGTRNALAG